MEVKTYSKKQDGAKQISVNFQVAEFACKDGSDKILIDDYLLNILQKIRNWAGTPININSAYRTAAHNKSVGGSPNSQHLSGMAADIRVSGKTPLQVAQYAESLGVGGIGHAPAGQGDFCHIDTRKVTCRWEYYNKGKTRVVSGFGGTVIKPPAANTAIVISPKTIWVDGKEQTIRAGLVDGENYVHLRDFVAAIGGTVEYDGATKQIRVTI